MKICEDNDIFLSQLISGILLFKREIDNLELMDIMSLIYKNSRYEITEMDSIYDKIYEYLDIYNDFFSLRPEYDYDSVIIIDGKKMKFYKFLINNTTNYVINFLSENVYIDEEMHNYSLKESVLFSKINSLVKTKKKRKLKHGTY